MRFLLVIFILFGGAFNSASANVCITGSTTADEVAGYALYGAYIENDAWLMDGGMVHKASLTCQDLDVISNGLNVTSIALQGFAIYAACTGVGLPAAVYAESAVVGLQVIDLVVSNLDCEDSEEEAKVQKKVDEAVCRALEAQGMTCQPPLEVQQI